MKVLHILSSARRIDTFPSVYNAIYLMKKYGFVVDLASGGDTNSIPAKVFIDNFLQLDSNVFKNALMLSNKINKYDYVVAYEPVDLELIGLITKLVNITVTLIFHNLEIPFYRPENSFSLRHKIQDFFLSKLWMSKFLPCKNKICKLMQIYFYNHLVKKALFVDGLNKTKFLLIQDNIRAHLFSKNYGIQNKPTFFVPNSYLPILEEKYEMMGWFEPLMRDSRKKILYVGSVESWALDLNLIKMAATLKDYIWIFSGWSRDGFTEKVKAELNGVSSDNIVFNLQSLSLGALNFLVDSCDIGLCYYRYSDDENINKMGLSSGKFHKFLNFNKPVLIPKGFIGLSDFAQGHGFGESFDLSDLNAKILKISQNYSYYQKEIEAKYFSLCSFESGYINFLRALDFVEWK